VAEDRWKGGDAAIHSTDNDLSRFLSVRWPNAYPMRVFRMSNKRSRRGAAAVEFAIVAPVFFLLALGLVEIGRMVMLQQSLTNAAREGCRVAGLASSIDSRLIETRVRGYLQSVVGATATDAAKVRITAPATLANVPSETDLVVAVQLTYADATWLPLNLVGLNPTIAAEVRRKRE
jgi:Flp pilus assembly protein TadG